MATSTPRGQIEVLIARATALGNQPAHPVIRTRPARRRLAMLVAVGVAMVGAGGAVWLRSTDRVADTIVIGDDVPGSTMATSPTTSPAPPAASPATGSGATASTVAAVAVAPPAPVEPFAVEIEPDGLAHMRGALPDAQTAAEFRQSIADVVGGEAIVEEFTIDPRADPVSAGSGLVTQTLLFPSSLAGLEPIHAEELDVVAVLLAGRPELVVSIEGYTDDRGDEAQNIELSGARARRVAEYLVGRGVDRLRIVGVVGRGEADPRGDNLTDDGRALNRRVDLHLAVAG